MAQEITDSVKPPGWTWYATGPGTGIQLSAGHADAGRLVIPYDHFEVVEGRMGVAETTADGEVLAPLPHYSHTIFSDDHGTSWQVGGSAPDDRGSESEVVKGADGRLVLCCRN